MHNLIQRAQEGDTAALDMLWEQTRAFALAVSRRFQPTASVDADDLEQAAWLGFYTAVQKHTGKYSFLTLLDFCIRAECQQALHIRTSKRDPVTVSGDVLLPDGEHTLLDLIEDDSLPESDAALIGADLVRDVRAAVAELPERERMVIELHWFADMTLKAVGRRMCIGAERARQLEERAFGYLRDDPVLRTYAKAPPPNLYRTGLSRFLNARSSSTEAAALRFVTQEERRTFDLLASLKASGHL